MTRARPSERLLALCLVLAVAALAAGCEARRLAPDAVAACERCHGGDGSAAPPRSVRGLTETSARAVGAHRQHLSDGRIRRAVDCAECHVVPSRVEGHFGDAAATVTWSGPLARARGATPRWDPETERCSNVYCHGAVSGGGDAKSPRWTLVDGSQKGCGSCHGYPPPSHGPSSTACHLCHADTVLGDDTTIDVAGGKHVNGAIDVPGGSCGACHPVPPDTGAHRVHANPMSAADAAYGSLALLEDVEARRRHELRVRLRTLPPARPGAAPRSRRLRSERAARPGRLPRPGGRAGGIAQGAERAGRALRPGDGDVQRRLLSLVRPGEPRVRHVAPVDGGAGIARVRGVPREPAPVRVGRRGRGGREQPPRPRGRRVRVGPLPGDAGVLAHARSTAGTGRPRTTPRRSRARRATPRRSIPPPPGRRGSTGSTRRATTAPGRRPARRGTFYVSGSSARPATTAATIAAGAGKVRPLRHVNGRRDVAFDPRTALPAISWLPAAPNTPTRAVLGDERRAQASPSRTRRSRTPCSTARPSPCTSAAPATTRRERPARASRATSRRRR